MMMMMVVVVVVGDGHDDHDELVDRGWMMVIPRTAGLTPWLMMVNHSYSTAPLPPSPGRTGLYLKLMVVNGGLPKLPESRRKTVGTRFNERKALSISSNGLIGGLPLWLAPLWIHRIQAFV